MLVFQWLISELLSAEARFRDFIESCSATQERSTCRMSFADSFRRSSCFWKPMPQDATPAVPRRRAAASTF
jgi:hypothetical protein